VKITFWKEAPETYFKVLAKFFQDELKKLPVKTDGFPT
jgi:hypothetical protein